ncbi:MAG: phosphoribosylformylglycinamidine synthase I [Myxococcales bacterium]|nr:phosphoribosylformylglycinamidine synthase I [Myxococcales bacterium]
MKPPVLVTHVMGTNRDHDAAEACALAGGEPEIVPLAALLAGERRLMDYRMLVLPGGFSFGDDLGAGRVWSVALAHGLRDALTAFVESGRPVLGICNGFQALIKAGLIPSGDEGGVWATERPATLTHNASGHFECRWVELEANPDSPCVFTKDLTEPVFCPVAHGEGRVAVRDDDALASLRRHGQIALTYAGGGYPANPNGSVADIAGLCNARGNVLGLMPHPEDHIHAAQHPGFRAGQGGRRGLPLFTSGVRYAASL